MADAINYQCLECGKVFASSEDLAPSKRLCPADKPGGAKAPETSWAPRPAAAPDTYSSSAGTPPVVPPRSAG